MCDHSSVVRLGSISRIVVVLPRRFLGPHPGEHGVRRLCICRHAVRRQCHAALLFEQPTNQAEAVIARGARSLGARHMFTFRWGCFDG